MALSMGGGKQESIVQLFPGIPRPSQIDVLKQIEDCWNQSDVIVINAPTAFGKSPLAVTVLNYAQQKQLRSMWIVPDNMLVAQVRRDYPKIHVLRRKGDYNCICHPGFTCEEVDRRVKAGKKKGTCPSCPYTKAKVASRYVKQQACNYHIMLAHSLHRKIDVLIVDEAHLLIDLARDRAAKILWQFDYKFPDTIKTYGDLADWLETFPEDTKDKKLRQVRKEIRLGKDSLLVEKCNEYHGIRKSFYSCLKLKPVDVSDKCGFLWNTVGKIILMSATFNNIDLKELGLAGRKFTTIVPDSPIPKESRPFYFQEVSPMGQATPFKKWHPLICQALLQQITDGKGKGLIHATYSYAQYLEKNTEIGSHPRVLFHDKENKKQVFEEWQQSADKVLIASGMYTGIDLKGDLATWQIITKVPFPSLADPALRYLVQQDPKRYQWWAIRTLVQAYGRVCRTPTDFGETFMLDSNFRRLVEQNEELFPKWFLEAATA